MSKPAIDDFDFLRVFESRCETLRVIKLIPEQNKTEKGRKVLAGLEKWIMKNSDRYLTIITGR